MSEPTNTTALPRSPLDALPASIVASERAGGREMLDATVVPGGAFTLRRCVRRAQQAVNRLVEQER